MSADRNGGQSPRPGPSEPRPDPERGETGDLKIEIREGNWLWSWRLSRWNYGQHKWDRQRWKVVKTGSACSEAGARHQAEKVIRKLRTAKDPKRVVYYDQLRGREFDDPDESRSVIAPVLAPVRWLGRRIGL